MNKKPRGFSFLEIIIVVAVLGLLLLAVLPVFTTFRENQVLNTASADVFSALGQARSESMSSIDSSEYGVHFESDQVVIFRGISYSSADPDNKIYLLYSPAVISDISLTSGATELYFDRLTGAPSRSGSVTVTVGGTSKTIIISQTGSISVN